MKCSLSLIQTQVQNFRLVMLLVCSVTVVLCFNLLLAQERSPILSLGSSGDAEKLTASNKQVEKSSNKILCNFPDERSDVCEIKGEVLIHGASSSISIISPYLEKGYSKTNEIVRIRPYPGKIFPPVLDIIGEIRITSMSDSINSFLKCAVNHSIPAIIFSNGGFLGNLYHDFDDCLIPLFITSRQFNGEVQFLINNMQSGWIEKYKEIFTKLSNYELINLKDEQSIHCYPHVIVNLYSHKNLSVDPSRASNNYSSSDFVKFIRKSYSLDRELVSYSTHKKPRLLIITRNRNRKFTNIDEIVSHAKGLGFEVVAQEGSPNITFFSKTVNSFDVMMGVHGAGLTNFMFLPDNAIFIQVALLGKVNERATYGLPAIDRKLRYLQYDISDEESTLSEIYPRDHAVFTDPYSFHRQGFVAVAKIYLFQQNVKVNVTRFGSVLVRALELLRQDQ